MSITIGTILKPVGLRGELKIALLTDFPERFEKCRDVTIKTKEGESQPVEIESVRYLSPFVYLRLKGHASLEDVEPLVGGSILIPDQERMPLPEGSYYHFEIEGLDVFLEDGTPLGTVERILQTGSNDVYQVRHGEKEYLIPALLSIVREIDLPKKRMVIRPPEGLLEL
ncbi:MAG: 16S rRNA processing protein RimM [Nitrospirae bacterium]|nr:16S rRNA processing protein RimM [Candidatus Manganitrophaceae bacterium]